MALTELQLAHRRIAQLERQFKLIEWRRPEVMFDDGIHVVWRATGWRLASTSWAPATPCPDGSRLRAPIA